MKLSSSSSSSWLFAALTLHVGLLLFLTTTPSAVATFSQSQSWDDFNPKIHDITHTLFKEGIPTYDWAGPFKNLVNESVGENFVTGKVGIQTHMGTHVDSLAHMIDFNSTKYTADTLNLTTLNGPVLVVEIPSDIIDITAQVLQSLNLPVGLKRLILKTRNTYENLMGQPIFVPYYTGLTADAAEWLVQNTSIKLIGIDYMSISRIIDHVSVHETLFRNNDDITIPLECLNLTGVEPGHYNVHCLPLKVQASGAPVRCLLLY